MTVRPERRGRVGQYCRIFFSGVLLYLIAVLPFLIYHGGIFFYYGDYNVQQVPFYILAHRAVRNGNLFWNWNVDLGTSMGGSFAFYLWGSPFFWFSCLFPERWIPYMMPFFMSLKYGTAMCTSFAWLRRNTRTERGALMGAFLYSFSGFQACNIVFQHFHEAVAFFPLYLLALDCFHDSMGKVSSGSASAACGGAVNRDLSAAEAAGGHSHHAACGVFSRRLGFVLMTALMSVVNYFFFYGQVLFLILYYIVRYAPRQKLSATPKEAGLLILHGLLGLCLSAFFLIQVYDVVMGNTRLTDILLGYDMVAYSEQTTPLAILKSLFMVPDIIGRGSLFTNDQVKNSSLSMFLPCFAVTGAIAWFRSHRKDWRKSLLVTCLIVMFIPILNSAFALFNSEYYARWFYMPLLFLALVTVLELEDCDRTSLISGAAITIIMDAVLILCALLPTAVTDEEGAATGEIAFMEIMDHPELFAVEALATCLMLPAMLWIILQRRSADPSGTQLQTSASAEQPAADVQTQGLIQPQAEESAAREYSPEAANESSVESAQERSAEPPAQTAAEQQIPHGKSSRNYGLVTRPALALVIVCCLLTQMAVLYNGSSLIAKSGGVKWKSQMLDNVPEIPGYSDYNFQRIEADGTSTNYEMVWGYPTIHCFESTVSPGIFRFYHGIGYNRTVDSKMNLTHKGARAILSDRYYLENAIISHDKTFEEEGGLPGFTKEGESDGFAIYQNQHYIPMGFTFDSCMSEDTYSSITDKTKADRLLVKDLILSDEDIRKYRHLFRDGQDTDLSVSYMSTEEFLEECDTRAASSCTSFTADGSGFQAETALDRENLVFFSVPFDKGWTCTVDGVKTDIIQADFGLCAVDVPAGTHDIVFRFLPWGLGPATALSAAAGFVILLLLCLSRRKAQ